MGNQTNKDDINPKNEDSSSVIFNNQNIITRIEKKIEFEGAENPIMMNNKVLPFFIWKYLFLFFGIEDYRELNRLKIVCKYFYKIIHTDEELDLRSKFFSFDDFEHSSKDIHFSQGNRKIEGSTGITWYHIFLKFNF
jgi:hypothetical protein